MTTIAELCPIIQCLLTETANRLAEETGFIRRKRQVSGASFAQSTVLGWLNNPNATRKQLHHAAMQTGMDISLQGLDKRFTPEAVVFMRALLEEGLKLVLSSAHPKACFRSFEEVYLTDCSQTRVGDKEEKLAVRLGLKHGQMQLTLEAAHTHDQRTQVMTHTMSAGALHIADLGFFNLKRFQTWNEQGVYWLSRFKVGTWLYDQAGQPLDLLTTLSQPSQEQVTFPVQVGKRQRLGAYLVAQRVSDAVYQQRQAQFKELRRRQHPVSALKETLAQWTIYLTSIPHLTFEQAHILARSRWQIELLFKLWKSHARLTHSRSANPLRQQCEFYAKLVAILIAHWLLLVSGWHHLHLSAVQALQVIRPHVFRLLRAFSCVARLNRILHDIQHDLGRSGYGSSRRLAPSASQLWLLFDASSP